MKYNKQHILNLINNQKLKQVQSIIKSDNTIINELDFVENIHDYLDDSKEIIGKIYKNFLIVDNEKLISMRTGNYKNFVTLICMIDFNMVVQDIKNFKSGHNACFICEPDQKQHSGHYTKAGLSGHTMEKYHNNMTNRVASDNKYTRYNIKINENWSNTNKGLQCFIYDMYDLYKEAKMKYPDEQITIDRLNHLDIYSKETCRWATYQMQNRNLSSNKFTEETAAICKYEFNELEFPIAYLVPRYNDIFNKETIRCTVMDDSNPKSTWKNIKHVKSEEEYIELIIKHIDFVNLEAYPISFLSGIKFNIFTYLSEKYKYNLKVCGEALNTKNLSDMRYKRRKNNWPAYEFSCDDECYLSMYIIRNEINLNNFPKEILQEYKKFEIVYKMRMGYEIYKKSIEEINEMFPRMIPENIIKIINYEVKPWFKPSKFVMTPISIR